jgi:hypothetical protein
MTAMQNLAVQRQRRECQFGIVNEGAVLCL